ncbi:MAG: PDDEXK family nuclease [Acidimicrobiales bacterium]
MRAVILDPPASAAGLVETGPFNLGEPDDFRAPDRSVHRDFDPDAVYFPTAAVVVEIVSPGDETYYKLPIYTAHGSTRSWSSTQRARR